jgi:hypothetical protein
MKSIYLKPDVNGIVREKFLRVEIEERVRASKLNKFVPGNSVVHKVTNGDPEEYANYFISLMKKSSKLNANFITTTRSYSSTGNLKEVQRLGLFSINPLTCPNVNIRELLDPKVNVKEGIRLYEELILREGNLPDVIGVVSI